MCPFFADSPEIRVTSLIFQKGGLIYFCKMIWMYEVCQPCVLIFFNIFLLVAVVAVIGLCVLVSSVLLVSLILCQRKRTRRRKNKKNGRLTGEGRTAVPALRYLVSRLNSLIDTWRAILCFKRSSVVIGTGHQHEETELQLQGLSTRGNIADFWSTISYT